MGDPIRISAKNLGALALASFCPRCAWIRLKLGNKLPYQSFPGIFSSIDSFSKRIVHAWFDRHGGPPPYLSPLGDIRSYVEPPHFAKFKTLFPEYDIELRGTPDGVFRLVAGGHVIVDYKTAKYTGTQDQLFPMYEAQLNAYAAIGERCGLGPVRDLALVYFEPVTDEAAATPERGHRDGGFVMEFAAAVHRVAVAPGLLTPLLAKTRALLDLASAPAGGADCRECVLLAGLVDVATLKGPAG